MTRHALPLLLVLLLTAPALAGEGNTGPVFNDPDLLAVWIPPASYRLPQALDDQHRAVALEVVEALHHANERLMIALQYAVYDDAETGLPSLVITTFPLWPPDRSPPANGSVLIGARMLAALKAIPPADRDQALDFLAAQVHARIALEGAHGYALTPESRCYTAWLLTGWTLNEGDSDRLLALHDQWGQWVRRALVFDDILPASDQRLALLFGALLREHELGTLEEMFWPLFDADSELAADEALDAP